MGLFTNCKFENLDDLLVHELRDLYDAEKRLTKALPKMADAAHQDSLKSAFQDHLRETENQVRRLEKAMELLGVDSGSVTCDAMKGLVSEGDDMVDAKGDPDVRDAALIAAAQRVEHYEIAGYGTARTLAERCGRTDVASLMQETLEEEKSADELLTQIAESQVNVAAGR